MKVRYSLKAAKEKTSLVKGGITELESEFLYRMAREGKGKGVVVEIGSFQGKSTIFLGYGSKTKKREKVFAIDPHKGAPVINRKFSGPTYKQFLANIAKAKIKRYIIPIKKTSDKAIKGWSTPIRFLFIDGDHSYKVVGRDLENYLPFVSRGGVVALHDALHPGDGPPRAISEKLLNKKFSHMGVVDSVFYCSKKPAKSIEEKINWYFYVLMIRLACWLINISNELPKRLGVFVQQQIVKGYLKQLLTYTTRKWQ